MELTQNGHNDLHLKTLKRLGNENETALVMIMYLFTSAIFRSVGN